MNVLTIAKRIAKETAKSVQVAGEKVIAVAGPASPFPVLVENDIPNHLGKRAKQAQWRKFLTQYNHRQYQAGMKAARPTAHLMPVITRWPVAFLNK